MEPFEFRWRDRGGKWMSISCYAGNEEEAAIYARRHGWPGHDGSRLNYFRSWLKRTVLNEQD
ncbi:MAG TPA: hypothetical protein VED40_08055 [Azospirillaceae bacterium]|nr:hypothetical protein [Azospirillaceae bacterium]